MTLSLPAWLNRAMPLRRMPIYASGLALLAGMAMSLADVTFVSPWLRVIGAIVVFILPGGYLFALIPLRDDWDLIDFVGYGFAYSITLMTILGLITRTFYLSIDTVELIWYALAIIGFVAVAYRSRALPRLKLRINTAILALLAIVILQGALYVRVGIISASRSDDRERHHAETNSYFQDEPLGWAEPYYETGNFIADRMYLTYWVMAQALVVEISGVPILLTRYLMQPLVMILSIAAMVIFARNLGHSAKAALLAAVLGLLAYGTVLDNNAQPGSQFLIEAFFDKSLVGFMLAPLAISTAYHFYRNWHWRAGIAFTVTMIAATCVHALVAGFSVFIIGIWCFLQLATDAPRRRRALQLGLLTLLIFSPAILSRIATEDTTIYNFGETSIDRRSGEVLALDWPNPLDGGNRAYMIHPAAAGHMTYILLPLVLLAMLARRFGCREKLLLAYVVAIGVGLLPITATLYGRLVSVYHIMRALWLVPYGYLLFFVLDTGLAVLIRRLPRVRSIISKLNGDRALIAFCLIALLCTAQLLQRRDIASYSLDIALSSEDVDLLAMGEYIDAHHDDRVWVAASPAHRERPIVLSWKAISLSRYSVERMVYYSRIPAEQAAMQESDNYLLFSGATSVADRLTIIDRYGINYLLFHEDYSWLVDGLYQHDKSRFELVHMGETLRLVRVHGTGT